MNDLDMAPDNCPKCGYFLDKSMGVTDPNSAPTPGCITICAACASILIFDKRLKLRLPTEEEFDQLRFDDGVLRAQKAVRLFNAQFLRDAPSSP